MAINLLLTFIYTALALKERIMLYDSSMCLAGFKRFVWNKEIFVLYIARECIIKIRKYSKDGEGRDLKNSDVSSKNPSFLMYAAKRIKPKRNLGCYEN